MGHTDILPMSTRKFAHENSLFLSVLVFMCQQSKDGLLIFCVKENKFNSRNYHRELEAIFL